MARAMGLTALPRYARLALPRCYLGHRRASPGSVSTLCLLHRARGRYRRGPNWSISG